MQPAITQWAVSTAHAMRVTVETESNVKVCKVVMVSLVPWIWHFGIKSGYDTLRLTKLLSEKKEGAKIMSGHRHQEVLH